MTCMRSNCAPVTLTPSILNNNTHVMLCLPNSHHNGRCVNCSYSEVQVADEAVIKRCT